MVVVDFEGAWDLLKGVPVTLWMLSSVMLLSTLSPACAMHELTAHRMQQFDLYGTQYGEGLVKLFGLYMCVCQRPCCDVILTLEHFFAISSCTWCQLAVFEAEYF